MVSIHTHGPCRECKGKAVYRGTEHHHWKLAQALIVALETPDNGSTVINSSHVEETELPGTAVLLQSSGTTLDNASSSVTSSSLHVHLEADHNTVDSLQEESLMDVNESSTADGHSDHDVAHTARTSESTASDRNADNNLLVLEAVLKAMKITDDVRGSQANFLSILEFGKEMYYKHQIYCSQTKMCGQHHGKQPFVCWRE